MNGIQIINNLQDDGVIQMIWTGTVSLYAIHNSLTELNRILHTRMNRVHLIITVDPATHLTDTINPYTLPKITARTCRGWMIIGGNGSINQTINQIMRVTVPAKRETTQ